MTVCSLFFLHGMLSFASLCRFQVFRKVLDPQIFEYLFPELVKLYWLKNTSLSILA